MSTNRRVKTMVFEKERLDNDPTPKRGSLAVVNSTQPSTDHKEPEYLELEKKEANFVRGNSNVTFLPSRD